MVSTRRINGFCERNGSSFRPKNIQINELLPETRTRLLNKLNFYIEIYIEEQDDTYAAKKRFASKAFDELYAESIKDFLSPLDSINERFEETFEEGDVYDVLEIIDWFCNEIVIYDYEHKDWNGQYLVFNLFEDFNKLFKEENMGYRFINKMIAPISDEEEVKTIQNALDGDNETFNKHFSKALSFLSGKEPDFQNSIKESFVALEIFLNSLADSKGKTCGKVIDELKEKINLHPALCQAIKDLYGFTSDENGIRHGNGKDEHEIDYCEAKFVLLIVSSTYNYLKERTALNR